MIFFGTQVYKRTNDIMSYIKPYLFKQFKNYVVCILTQCKNTNGCTYVKLVFDNTNLYRNIV